MFWTLHRSWSHEASLIFAVLGYCFLGAALAQNQTNRVAAPVLDYPIYGRLKGDIHLIDRSQSDALRLTLGNVQHEKLPPAKIPKFVRISLHDVANEVEIRVGRRIATKAYLMPPMRPVEPRGFDFRRHAWFQSLGRLDMRAPQSTIWAMQHHPCREVFQNYVIASALLYERGSRESLEVWQVR
jgi:competence protein ComEC